MIQTTLTHRFVDKSVLDRTDGILFGPIFAKNAFLLIRCTHTNANFKLISLILDRESQMTNKI